MDWHPASWRDTRAGRLRTETSHAVGVPTTWQTGICHAGVRCAAAATRFPILKGHVPQHPRETVWQGGGYSNPALFTSRERWKQADGGWMNCLFSLGFCLWLTDWEPARRAGVVGSAMPRVANKFEGKAPRYRLLGGLGKRWPFLWRQGKRWSPEWLCFWDR